jgi:hypothetical protein
MYEEEYDDDYEDEEGLEDEDNGVVKITLPKPHEGQKKVVDSNAKWKILSCGRRWGKSFICLILSLQKMLQGKSVAYVTPTFSLAGSFFNEILRYIPNQAISYVSKKDLYIKLITGGELTFFSGEATRSIRGRAFSRIIIDEAAFIPDLENIWTQAIQPTLATTNGDALFVSTPNGMNYFYSLFLKGKYKEANYESFHFPSSSSPFVDKAFLESIKKDVSDETYRQEYEAEPLSSTGNPFGIEHIKRNVIQQLSIEETVVFAIDIAKHLDYTVIIGLDEDGNMTYFDRFKGEYSLIEQKIINLPQDTLKIVDSTGIGDVIFERLQQTANNVQGFKFSSKSKPNLMRELIVDVQKGNIKYNETTAEEMMVFEYSLTSTGHPIYQAQSGYHDDCIMSLAMANHYRKQAYNLKHWQLITV